MITGAGLSTESGIPAYRDADGVRRGTPMMVGELLGSTAARRRYWARAYAGWPRFASAAPNDGHRAVADLQRAGLVQALITQNVDGLHQAAGAHDVVELHGTLSRVRCMHCDSRFDRADVDRWLTIANPGFDRDMDAVVQPDGDIALPQDVVNRFCLAHCVVCGSDVLKPDVVMFGESVPREVVDWCFEQVRTAGCVLVLGSSLAVMSGYRFVRRAAQLGVPVVAITQGWTRGDAETTYKIQRPLGVTLRQLAREVRPTGH